MSLLRTFFKLKYNWLPYIILVPGVHILLLPTAMAPHSTPAPKQGTHLQWKSGLSFPGWGGDFWWYRTPLPQSRLSRLEMMWLRTGPLHLQPEVLSQLARSGPRHLSTESGAGDTSWWTRTPGGSLHSHGPSLECEGQSPVLWKGWMSLSSLECPVVRVSTGIVCHTQIIKLEFSKKLFAKGWS